MVPALDSFPAPAISETIIQFGSLAEIESLLTVPVTPNENSSPLSSNLAPSNPSLPILPSPSPPVNLSTSNPAPLTATLPLHPPSQAPAPTLAETLRWSSVHSSATPPLSSIKIWAHLTGVPLDLRYKQGLSLVAGLIGNPKETNDFTLNLVSLTLSHVKVEVDLTKPLPSVVEFERQSGEVAEVLVEYPWLPPTCSHCHELGHVIRNCLLYSPPKAPPPAAKVPGNKQKQKASETLKRTPASTVKDKHY
ncbi:uncharacterized protein LOC108808404 [Raphanus sativus]|uniref:Uncharacterized protein LOC108808404 n=1 Tax=Raphanus sativus TaxID=3726 RepID=A0A6J0JK79_RAPSA|nr:uncharacterized protein LOC108808404 [Raphanus sativus]